MDRELQEWLGLAPADFFCYFALLLLPVIYVVDSQAIDLLLVVLVIVANIAACVLGMPRAEGVSGLTNSAKFIAYPTCLAFSVAACVLLILWP